MNINSCPDVESWVNSNHHSEKRKVSHSSQPLVQIRKAHTPKKGEKCNCHGDSFVSKQPSSKGKGAKIGTSAAAFLMALTMLASMKGCTQPKTPENNFDAQGLPAAQVAAEVGVDSRVITLANGVKIDDPLYDMILPKEVASEDKWTVYADEDDRMVYFIPNETGVKISELKEAYDIKDGVFAKHNDLEHTYEREGEARYKEYTDKVPNRGLKIPYNETNLD